MKGFRTNKEDYIVSQLPNRGTILHVGCAHSPRTLLRWEKGTLLHKAICDKVKGSGAKVVGIDIDNGALDFLKERLPGEEIYNVDAHKLSEYFGDRVFDLIVAGDIIEHLPNPGLFLESCRRVLSADGRIIITTVNAYSVARFLKSIFFHEAVHPEHTAYYSNKTLTRLVEMSGLIAARKGYYICEPVKVFSLSRYISNTIENLVCMVWPQWSEGIIITATKEK